MLRLERLARVQEIKRVAGATALEAGAIVATLYVLQQVRAVSPDICLGLGKSHARTGS